ncbi:anti-sigma factor domain-containing protein [Streptomyces sp. NPDC088732]|uniref:anti-sigma factor n=1 Tax=Streptomyces sp. NPDC088732 TaxID=3365879 RepID=UPI003828B73A
MRRSVHELAEPYALDALGPREARRFEAHLLRCDACAQRVGGLERSGGPGGAGTVWLGGAAPADVVTAPGEVVLEHTGGPRWERGARPGAHHRWRWGRPPAVRLAASAAAAALALAAVLGVLLHRSGEQLERERARTRAVTEVLTASDARPAYTSDDHGRGMTAVCSRALRRAVVTVQGLPRPAEGRVYQVWLVSERPEAYRSIGVLEDGPGAGDTPGPLVASGLDGRSYAFTVTIEPSGGSPQPTADPVAQLPLLALGIDA